MAQTVQHKRSSSTPSPTTLAQGELAFTKNGNGTGEYWLYIGDPAAADTPIQINGALVNNNGSVGLGSGITALEVRSAISAASTVDELTDVTITTIASGEILKWNGSAWINNTLAEANIQAADGNLPWSQVTSTPTTLSGYGITDALGTSTNLGDLNNVTVTTIATGEILQWNGSAWVNQTFSEANIQAADGNLPWTQVTGTPTTLAGYGITDAATSAQGSLADSAVQPGDDADTLGSGAASDNQVLTADGAAGAAWETIQFSWLGGTPTTLSGYGITDALDTSTNFGDLNNVTVTAIGANELIQWNGSAWVNQTIAEIGLLTDITGENLDSLNDVTITTIATDELLQWNGSAWVNQTIAEIGLITDQPAIIDSAGNPTLNAGITDVEVKDLLNLGTSDSPQFTDLTLTGDLNVGGAINSTSTTELLVEDTSIYLNSTYAGSSPTLDAAIEVERGTVNNARIVWNETANQWEVDDGTGAVPIATGGVNSITTDSQGLGGLIAADGAVNIELDLDELNTSAGPMVGTDYLVVVDATDDVKMLPANIPLSLFDNDLTIAQALDDLTDVTITAAATGEVLRYNGSAWVDATLAFADLGSTPTTFAGYGIVSDLDEINDVTITSIAAGELLKWNGSAWVNNTIAEAGLATAAQGSAASTAIQTVTLDSTDDSVLFGGTPGVGPVTSSTTTPTFQLTVGTVDGGTY